MKAYNSVGCTIEGISEKEFIELKKVGWMTEEEYRKINSAEEEIRGEL